MAELRSEDPESIGAYQLRSRLGAGGMGQVFLAVSADGVEVAVKRLRPELAASREFLARFAREVEAARRVGGVHTAQVVDADPHGNPPWLATTYIPGPSLHEVIQGQGPLDPGEVNRLGSGLAKGLSDIHQCGLIHRDLKPGNVIMAADRPQIIDFGIARAADATTLTVTGAVVGTYAYMSPEQITADRATAASDVFALGCVLAFAATGIGPFDATSIPAIVHRITNAPPNLEGVTGELREVIEACLAKNPLDRPSTATVVARLTAAAVAVLAPTVVENLSSAEIKPPVDMSVPAIGKASPPTQIIDPDDAPPQPGSRQPPRRPTRFSRRALMFGGLGAAAAAVVPVAALWPKSENSGNTYPEDTDGKSSAGSLESSSGEKVLQPEFGIYGFVFSEDGKAIVGNDGGTLRRWEVATGKSKGTYLEFLSDVERFSFSADGTMVATSGQTDTDGVHVWDVSSGEKISTLDIDFAARMLFLPDGRTLVTSFGDGARLWDLLSGDKFRTLTEDYVTDSALSPDGKTLAIATQGIDGKATLWDMPSGDKLASLPHDDPVWLEFSPDGKSLACSGGTSKGSSVWAWDVSSRETSRTYIDEYAWGLGYSPDSNILAAAGDAGIWLWNADNGEKLVTLSEERARIVAFSPDGGLVAAMLERDFAVHLWKVDPDWRR